jgi:Flp pilus assembly protein TadD
MTAAGATSREEEARAALAHGIRLFEGDDVLGAHAQFGQAHRRLPADPRVLSWYGLTLVLVERNSNLGMALSDQAVRLAGPEPDLVLNQARAYLALGLRERAVRALRAGVALWPEDPSLRAATSALGRRQRPVVFFLSRAHPLNRILGKLRHRWSRAASAGPVTPATLGRLAGPHPGRAHG